MSTRHPARVSAVILGLLVGLARAAEVQPPGRERPGPARRWFSLPIQVSGLPADAEFVPVSCEVDFSGLLARLKVTGAVDERSIRLLRLLNDGGEMPEPVQFVASAQPRARQRRLLGGTTPRVSYLSEYAAGETPEVPKTVGELCWIARSGPQGVSRYRLRFGIPRGGRMIQVPFSPQNLRAFDAEGRATPVWWFPRMQIRPQWPLHGEVHVLENNRLVTTYHTGPDASEATAPPPSLRRPFFYPVNGPDDVSLTEFGKPHDPTGSHAHHYSLWIAHASVEGHDFWSERGGIIAHDQFALLEDGPVLCRLIQKTRWIHDGRLLLRGRREFTVYRATESFRLMDVELQLSPAGSKPVTLGQTTFGLLAVRVAQSMTVFDGGGEILNARGDRNEQNAHLKRATWLDQSGPIAPGKWGGIAIFDHPENPNHPTGWHCRNDGWAGAALNMDRPIAIPSAETLRLRYRILLHRHNAAQGGVARNYEAYRARPAIDLGQPVAEE